MNTFKKLIVVFLIATTLIPIAAIAQTESTTASLQTRGLEITPFLLDLDVAKGKEISSQIDLTNRSTAPLIITVSPRDFLPGIEGQPEFVPDTEINDPSFSLATWISLDSVPTQFTIQPEEQVTVPFTIRPPANAEDGTHYGALLFSYVGSSATGSASEVQQTVGSILLVRYGVGRELGETTLKTSSSFQLSTDKITFTNTFKNTGNVHVQPKGDVVVRNIFGQTVATPFVNRDAANVLPRTERSFVNSWLPSSFSFGRYTAESVLIYGRGRLEAKDKQVIWVFPIYLLVVLGIIVSIILWFIFHGRHWHRRRIIERHINRIELKN